MGVQGDAFCPSLIWRRPRRTHRPDPKHSSDAIAAAGAAAGAPLAGGRDTAGAMPGRAAGRAAGPAAGRGPFPPVPDVAPGETPCAPVSGDGNSPAPRREEHPGAASRARGWLGAGAEICGEVLAMPARLRLATPGAGAHAACAGHRCLFGQARRMVPRAAAGRCRYPPKNVATDARTASAGWAMSVLDASSSRSRSAGPRAACSSGMPWCCSSGGVRVRETGQHDDHRRDRHSARRHPERWQP
ncbi:hypothetical protein GA0115240_117717 [Streptomyces sp. DvalAA-14]|nr:hypothetical protein GA0115240_117717 [Streptomyces sp. DvalAA-14]